MLWRFDAARDGPALDSIVRILLQDLLREDHEDSMDADELAGLLEEQDPDWDLPWALAQGIR
jgi:hypothetical protein